MVQVWHYDGASGIRHTPELVAEGAQFRLRLDSGLGEAHAWTDLIYSGEKGGSTTFGHKGRRGWRIGFDGPIPAEIAAKLPPQEKYGRVIDRIGLWPATGAFVLLSAVAVFIGLKTPQILAPLVPPSLEKKLGDAMVGDFGGRVCNGPGGQEALDVLVRRVEPKPDGLKVRVVNIAMVNAVAMPGGNIFIFRGLLQEAKSPDELAGVVAHEIGHVRNRDVMQALLRQMGLSVLLGGANADVGGSINALVASTYSREAEAAADQYAIRAMRSASVSPLDTAGFFARLSDMEEQMEGKVTPKTGGDAAKAKTEKGATEKGATEKGKVEKKRERPSLMDYLASHPASDSREKMFRASAVPGKAYTPVVTAEQWRAIVDSCKNDPDVEQDDGFLF